jgi:CheY-like chemotaxis protein
MKQTWLVVEDDPIIRSILTALMTLWGVENIVFKDGHEAYRWLDAVESGDPAARLPDIALLDIRMPGAQGHEIGKRMRSLSVTQHIPIVIMTAYQLTREEREQIMEMARPEQIISKPLPAPDDLRALLEKTVRDVRSSIALKRVRLVARRPQYRYLIDAPTSRRIARQQSARHLGQLAVPEPASTMSFKRPTNNATPSLSRDEVAGAA